MKPSTKKSLSLWACLLLVFVRGLFIDFPTPDSPLDLPISFVFGGLYACLCLNWFLVDASLHGTTIPQMRPRLHFARVCLLTFPRYFRRTRGKTAWKPTLFAVAFLPISFAVLFLGAIIVPLSKIVWYWFAK